MNPSCLDIEKAGTMIPFLKAHFDFEGIEIPRLIPNFNVL
jgi:hypothetical protein